jgi:hypothetical protein
MAILAQCANQRSTSILRRLAAPLALAGALFLSACESLGIGTEPLAPAPEIGIYELRIYTAAPGKLAALDARFRDHTLGLFRRHGMTPIGFFHVNPPTNGGPDNRLVYIMGYKDKAARDKAWTAFAADPEWKQVYNESEARGELLSKAPESTFLTTTDYSPQLDMRGPVGGQPRLFELRTYTTNPGKLEDLHNRFRDHTLRIFAKHGMTNFLYWRPTGGQPQMDNKMVYLLAFPDIDSRTTSFRNFSADTEWQKVSTDSNKNGPILATPNGVVALQLIPTDYSPLK